MIEPLASKKVLGAISALREKVAKPSKDSSVKEGVDLASIATKLLRNRDKAKKE